MQKKKRYTTRFTKIPRKLKKLLKTAEIKKTQPAGWKSKEIVIREYDKCRRKVTSITLGNPFGR